VRDKSGNATAMWAFLSSLRGVDRTFGAWSREAQVLKINIGRRAGEASFVT
jgi:hypothetical protein